MTEKEWKAELNDTLLRERWKLYELCVDYRKFFPSNCSIILARESLFRFRLCVCAWVFFRLREMPVFFFCFCLTVTEKKIYVYRITKNLRWQKYGIEPFSTLNCYHDRTWITCTVFFFLPKSILTLTLTNKEKKKTHSIAGEIQPHDCTKTRAIYIHMWAVNRVRSTPFPKNCQKCEVIKRSTLNAQRSQSVRWMMNIINMIICCLSFSLFSSEFCRNKIRGMS